jgi:hypothetical protein
MRTVRDALGGTPARLVHVLLDIAEDRADKVRPADRVAACRELWSRGWGLPPAYAPADGGNPLEDEVLAEVRAIADELAARRATQAPNGAPAALDAPEAAV